MRRLVLAKETLADLTPAELGRVHGAAASGLTCPLRDCATYLDSTFCITWGCTR